MKLAIDAEVRLIFTDDDGAVSVQVVGLAGPFQQTVWITSTEPRDGFSRDIWAFLWRDIAAFLDASNIKRVGSA